MTLVDLLTLPGVEGPRLSPDGDRIAFVKETAHWDRNRRVEHIWVTQRTGGESFQLTNGDDGEDTPRWSPEGSRIAFLADRSDTLETQIYLINPDGGEAQRLTAHATGVSDIQWSPDGQWIYFRADDEPSAAEKAQDEAQNDVIAFEEDYEHSHLWRVDAATGEAERITDGDWSVTGYRLGWNGEQVAYHRAPTPLLDDLKQWDVWVMSATGEEHRQVTNNAVPEYGARLSPDGSQVLFRADANADFDFYYNANLFVASVEGGTSRLLLEDVPHEIDDAEWSQDGSAIFLSANMGARQNLFRVRVQDEQLEQLTEGGHAVSGWSYHPGTGHHVFTVATPQNPGDVWTMPEAGGAWTRGTRIFEDIASRYRLPRQELITYEGRDGTAVEGLLFYPLDYQEDERYPLVVQTHGGPASSDQFGFGSSWDYPHVLTAMGYMVFQPNYRGSTGYGDAFMRDMVGHYFNEAHRDVMAGVDYLIEEGLVDGDRMAKMGWSAGGHMTNKIITYTDRFKAASSGAGAANWVSMYAQSDVRIYRTPWFEGSPWEENAPIDTFWQNSPLADVAAVSTPTIFLVGQEDNRVPMPQSVEMYRGVKANDVPTHLYVAPREAHGWSELRHRLFKANVEIAWFERWVRDRTYDWVKAPGDTGEETAIPDWAPTEQP
jgi:dipeptidyl aminopeptidase/acylaminoacyl peptidase